MQAAESELFPCCRALGLRVVTYNATGGGLLSGKIANANSTLEKGGRFDAESKTGKMYRDRYFKEPYFDAVQLIKEATEKHNIGMTEAAHRWLQHHSLLTPSDGVIIGGSSVAHIDGNCKESEGGPLPDEVLAALNDAWTMTQVSLIHFRMFPILICILR